MDAGMNFLINKFGCLFCCCKKLKEQYKIAKDVEDIFEMMEENDLNGINNSDQPKKVNNDPNKEKLIKKQ